jgi:hypothetical protein
MPARLSTSYGREIALPLPPTKTHPLPFMLLKKHALSYDLGGSFWPTQSLNL